MKTVRISLLLAMLILCNLCHAQFGWGVTGGVGLSQISGKLSFSSVPVQVYPSPSFAIGVLGQFNPGKVFCMETQVLYSVITDHFKITAPITDAFGVLTNDVLDLHFHRGLSFLSVPMMVGCRVKAWQFLGGFQGSAFLFGSYRELSEKMGGFTPINNRGRLTGIDRFDYGPKVAATWNFRGKWAAEASFYQGLPNLLPPNSFQLSWHTRQLLLGLRYHIR